MTYSQSGNDTATGRDELRAISLHDLANLAIEDIAYVKPSEVSGESVYAIYAADGTELGYAYDRDIAFIAVRQHDLDPVSVH
jgi:hypothetical protein